MARYYVSNGVVSSGIVLENYDSMYVFNGGIADDIFVNDYACLYVSNGGVLNCADVYRDGFCYVANNGIANSTVVNNGGIFYFSNGGILNDTTVNSGGCLYGYVGGSSIRAVVNGGLFYIYRGAYVSMTAVNNGGFLYIASGGIAKDTSVNNAYCHISSGGVASSIAVSRGGIISVLSEGTVRGAVVKNNGHLIVYNEGTASDVVVDRGGDLNVYSTGSAFSVMEKGGYVYVAEGAKVTFALNTISGLVLGSSDRTTVHSATTAIDISVNNGDLSVCGGIAEGTSLTSGTVTVFDGGRLSNTSVSRKGVCWVEHGGKAVNTEVFLNGTFLVLSSGIADHINITSGTLHVSSGGTATNITAASGTVMSITVASNTYIQGVYGGSAFEMKDAAISGYAVNNKCSLKVYDGTANNIAVNSSGVVNIYSGGTANNTNVNGGGLLWVKSSGMADNTVVESGGYMHVIGGTVNNTTISTSGDIYISRGGVATNTTVNSDGRLWVYSGGTASNTTVNGSGYLFVSSGGVANSTTVNGDYWRGGYLYVSSGGTATIVFNPWQKGTISAAYGATVEYLERDLSVYYGGRVSGLLSKGEVFDSLTINNGNSALVYSGGVTNSTTVDGGELYVFSGGVASSTTVNGDFREGGYLYVSSGGVANATTVNSDGCLTVSSGGVANSTTVNSSGRLYVSSGGVANNTTVNDSGIVDVYSGGYVSGAVVNSGGWIDIYAGGSAIEIKENGGYVTVADTADVTFVPNTISSLILSGINTNATLHSCTTAKDTMIIGDGLLEISGGCAIDTNVDKGYLYVREGGVASNTIVNSHSNLSLNSGATHCGSLQIESGAVVSAYSGSIIDFTVADRTTADDYLINNLALIDGAPIYTITVAADQAEGTYKLAAGAESFNRTISIGDGSVIYGNVSLSESLTYDAVNYTLSNVDGNLNLTISGSMPAPEPEPEPTPEPLPITAKRFFAGAFDGSATDMLVSVKDGKVSIYANNAGWAELPLEDGWNVVGVTDFNGDGKADILRQHTSGLLIGEVSNGNGTFAPQVINSVGTGWAIEGTGDFNGDGVGDVLIANPTAASDGNPDYPADQPPIGLLGYWKGGTEWTLINGYSPEWEMVATGDYNNDGKTDMLWRNEFVGAGGLTYNAYCTWIVENANDWRMVSVANPDEWNYLCSGDFNADGCNDIAMINGEGVVGIWGVSDGYLDSWSILSAVDTASWELAGVGDFNGDGTDDIAWCNTDSGLTGYWQIKDKTLESWQNIATIA